LPEIFLINYHEISNLAHGFKVFETKKFVMDTLLKMQYGKNKSDSSAIAVACDSSRQVGIPDVCI
jgi:hypothetical protein